MTRRSLILAVAAVLVAPAAAQAHVQVAPLVVAPNDPVKFTVLVPGEREQQTVRVALKVPAGLLPFSYEDTPGWTRRLIKAANGGVDQIVWTGRLAHDGFVEFSFLAGTPVRPGRLAWRALQTYSDGTVVRWIGTPDSENPAPVTQVVKGAPRQNAGGEGGATAAATPSATAGTAAPSASGTESGGGADWIARILAILALLAAAMFARGRRREAAT